MPQLCKKTCKLNRKGCSALVWSDRRRISGMLASMEPVTNLYLRFFRAQIDLIKWRWSERGRIVVKCPRLVKIFECCLKSVDLIIFFSRKRAIFGFLVCFFLLLPFRDFKKCFSFPVFPGLVFLRDVDKVQKIASCLPSLDFMMTVFEEEKI